MSLLINNARIMAKCIVDVEWNQQTLCELLDVLLDGGPPDPRQLSARLMLLGDSDRSPSLEHIAHILTTDKNFKKYFSTSHSIRIQPGKAMMQPLPANLPTLPLPRLANCRDLAQWLGLSLGELDWFAGIDRRHQKRVETKLTHYRYEWRERAGGFPRLLEKPKPRLKSLQRLILSHILNRVPVHDCAHGFRRHHSCLTSATPHIGQEVLLRMDLQDFFISIARARIEGIFRMIGYPGRVAAHLAGICSHRTALDACGERHEQLPINTRQRLMDWHLPQGAPTSPALANLCAWRMDARLNGLAQHLGLTYSRYADDLALSGGKAFYHQRKLLEPLIGAIALEEGFRINHRKTAWMSSSQRQHFCGITLNRHPNIQRKEYDRLKAILHNCKRFGPESQNQARHADFHRHLEGRVGWLMQLNPAKGRKLMQLLHMIDWNAT